LNLFISPNHSRFRTGNDGLLDSRLRGKDDETRETGHSIKEVVADAASIGVCQHTRLIRTLMAPLST